MPRRKGSTRKARTNRGKRKTWKLDMEKVAPEVSRAVVERLGLDFAEITEEMIIDIIEDIIQGIAESRATKPSIDSLINNILRNKDPFLKAIASKLVELENHTPEQLEFIVVHAPEAAGRAAPKLYREASRMGLDHIVEALRQLWNRYGKPTPFVCPRCGFRGLTPLLECMVCGATIDEREYKEFIRFRELLKRLAVERPTAAMEIARAGFALYDGTMLVPPSGRRPGALYIELYLSREERETALSIARGRIEG